MSINSNVLAHADGYRARLLLGRLTACQQSGALCLNSEIEKVRIEMRPAMKLVFRDAAAVVGEPLAEFMRQAAIERTERLMGERVAESERLLAEEAAKTAEAA